MTGPVTGREHGLPDHRTPVRPEWIDYNGHLSEAYYVLVFGDATTGMMSATGLGADYRERTGCSLYTAEAHVRYLREVNEGAVLTVRTRVLGADATKVRLAHEMYVGNPANEAPVATMELLGVHVDRTLGRSAPMPGEIRDRLAGLVGELPLWAGRSIGPVPRRTPPGQEPG